MVTETPQTLATCVVLHRDRDRLEDLVDGLRCQGRPADQWIFCVNGADDGSVSWLKALPENPIVLDRSDNPGFSGGVNACIAVSDASHVLIMNADVVLGAGYVESCLRVFSEEHDVAGVGGKLVRGGGDLLDSAGFIIQPWMRVVDRGAGAPAQGRFAEREGVMGVCGAAAVFDRRVLLDVAEDGRVMDEDFWMYKEDQDLCMRLCAAGWRLVYEPSAKARHDRGWRPGSRKGVGLEVRRHSLKNRYLLLLKHWRWRRHGWTLPFVLSFEILLFLGLMLREPLTMKGYILAFRLVPRMLEKRQELIRRECGHSQPARVLSSCLTM